MVSPILRYTAPEGEPFYFQGTPYWWRWTQMPMLQAAVSFGAPHFFSPATKEWFGIGWASTLYEGALIELQSNAPCDPWAVTYFTAVGRVITTDHYPSAEKARQAVRATAASGFSRTADADDGDDANVEATS